MIVNNVTNNNIDSKQTFGTMSKFTKRVLLYASRTAYDTLEKSVDANRIIRSQLAQSHALDVSLSYLLPWRPKIVLADKTLGTKTKFSLAKEFDAFINSAVELLNKPIKPSLGNVFRKLKFAKGKHDIHRGWHFKNNSEYDIAERIYALGLTKGKKAEKEAIKLFNQIESNKGNYFVCYDNNVFRIGNGIEPVSIKQCFYSEIKMSQTDDILTILSDINKKIRKLSAKDQRDLRKSLKHYLSEAKNGAYIDEILKQLSLSFKEGAMLSKGIADPGWHLDDKQLNLLASKINRLSSSKHKKEAIEIFNELQNGKYGIRYDEAANKFTIYDSMSPMKRITERGFLFDKNILKVLKQIQAACKKLQKQ